MSLPLRTKAGVAALLVALAAAVGAAPAAAHATPEGSTPASGAALGSPPATVAVRFSEGVETALSTIRVFDARGRAVQEGRPFHPGGDGSALAVRLRKGLGDGGYTTTFRVVSADSHPASGGFTFGVGQAGDAIGVGELLGRQGGGPVTSLALAVARGIQYLAIALGVGVVAVLLLAWLPALRELATPGAPWRAASDAFARRARLLLLGAAAAGACSGSLAIALQGAVVQGSSLWAALGTLPEVLPTRFGTVWGAGTLAWLAVFTIVEGNPAVVPVLRPATVGATGVALPGVGRWLPAAAVPLLALALLPGLSGHAAVRHPVALLLPANVVHVLAAGAWIGGLAVLVLALPAATRRLEAPERGELLAVVLTRFSALALVAVCGVVAGGALQAGWELDGIGALLDTGFGRALAAKSLLVLGLLACGALNRRRIVPALAADPRAAAALRRMLRVEIALGVAALAISGVLSGANPG